MNWNNWKTKMKSSHLMKMNNKQTKTKSIVTNFKITNFIFYFLICFLFNAGCEKRPILTLEIAKQNSINLLNDLKIDYRGIVCIEQTNIWINYQYVNCTISTNNEILKTKCDIKNCELLEKKTLKFPTG